jgi:hypothetical protein
VPLSDVGRGNERIEMVAQDAPLTCRSARVNAGPLLWPGAAPTDRPHPEPTRDAPP